MALYLLHEDRRTGELLYSKLFHRDSRRSMALQTFDNR